MKTENALQVKNLTKTFGSGHALVEAVSDVSFDVFKSEIILIMGPSGSGKTTLLTMLGALLTPDHGLIIINGDNITDSKIKDLAKFRLNNIGFVFQSFNLLTALTALENVAIVLGLAGVKKKEFKEKSVELLGELGLKDRLNFLPKELSGGEKQRVSLARALINNPKIILADEPTANLDSKSGHHVMELLKNIAKKQGKTVIIVSHDMRIADIADRVLWLEDGVISSQLK
ncbi:MAG: ABC transporter ATP-binding protein [Actinobacteria bacterium]|nr:ABC transporter ATP-binding protein [Actinomycetota bacterium]